MKWRIAARQWYCLVYVERFAKKSWPPIAQARRFPLLKLKALAEQKRDPPATDQDDPPAPH
jgi:hypothetical protein